MKTRDRLLESLSTWCYNTEDPISLEVFAAMSARDLEKVVRVGAHMDSYGKRDCYKMRAIETPATRTKGHCFSIPTIFEWVLTHAQPTNPGTRQPLTTSEVACIKKLFKKYVEQTYRREGWDAVSDRNRYLYARLIGENLVRRVDEASTNDVQGLYFQHPEHAQRLTEALNGLVGSLAQDPSTLAVPVALVLLNNFKWTPAGPGVWQVNRRNPTRSMVTLLVVPETENWTLWFTPQAVPRGTVVFARPDDVLVSVTSEHDHVVTFNADTAARVYPSLDVYRSR